MIYIIDFIGYFYSRYHPVGNGRDSRLRGSDKKKNRQGCSSRMGVQFSCPVRVGVQFSLGEGQHNPRGFPDSRNAPSRRIVKGRGIGP